jgi:hypothetical protein
MHLLLGRSPGWWVVFLLGASWLMCGSAFGATAHDDAHGAFMTLPPYTRSREGEVQPVVNRPFPLALSVI